MMPSRAIIVLGMHRSGTSAFTGSLKCLGVELGGKLYAGHESINAKGYWEHSDIVDTHDEILRLLGTKWDDINPLPDNWHADQCIQKCIDKLQEFIQRDFFGARVWGLKDPRMCRLLPLWSVLLEKNKIKPLYVFICRHPLEVADSLLRRNDFHLQRGLLLWFEHNMKAERDSRGQERVFFTFEQLLTQPRTIFDTLEKKLGGQFPVSVEDGWSCIENFIETDLRHHQSEGSKAKTELEILCTQLFSIYIELSQRNFTEQDLIKLDIIYQRFEGYYSSLPGFLLQQISDLNHDYAQVLGLWQGVYHTYSWQILRVARFFERFIRDRL